MSASEIRALAAATRAGQVRWKKDGHQTWTAMMHGVKWHLSVGYRGSTFLRQYLHDGPDGVAMMTDRFVLTRRARAVFDLRSAVDAQFAPVKSREAAR